MTAVTLTRDLAAATGQDVGNRAMRSGNRTRWSAADYMAAISATNKLLLHVPYEHGGLGGLELPAGHLEGMGLTIEDVIASGNKVLGYNGTPEEAACSS